MKELTQLIMEVHPDACQLNVRFSFRLVFKTVNNNAYSQRGGNQFPIWHVRELGKVANNPNLPLSNTHIPGKAFAHLDAIADQDRTLKDIDFVQGDFLDVAIYYSRHH